MTPGGRYFFEVQINSGQLIKIGVCRSNIDSERAFCDTADGWAFYNGELRHGSNYEGIKYGEKFGEGDVIAVMFDTIQVSAKFERLTDAVSRDTLQNTISN